MTGFKMKNKYLLVRPLDKRRVMSNGIAVNVDDAADRKAIVQGTIIACEAGIYNPGTLVIFPLYAADNFVNDDAEVLWIIKGDDVMMVEKA